MSNQAERNELAVWKGGHGLPATFWGWGVMGSILLGFIISFVVGISEALPSLMICTFAFEFYTIFVLISTWRAASYFVGDNHWRLLARLVTLLWSALVSIVFLYLVLVLNSPYPNH